MNIFINRNQKLTTLISNSKIDKLISQAMFITLIIRNLFFIRAINVLFTLIIFFISFEVLIVPQGQLSGLVATKTYYLDVKVFEPPLHRYNLFNLDLNLFTLFIPEYSSWSTLQKLRQRHEYHPNNFFYYILFIKFEG